MATASNQFKFKSRYFFFNVSFATSRIFKIHWLFGFNNNKNVWNTKANSFFFIIRGNFQPKSHENRWVHNIKKKRKKLVSCLNGSMKTVSLLLFVLFTNMNFDSYPQHILNGVRFSPHSPPINARLKMCPNSNSARYNLTTDIS